jgi:hypothetical protein
MKYIPSRHIPKLIIAIATPIGPNALLAIAVNALLNIGLYTYTQLTFEK